LFSYQSPPPTILVDLITRLLAPTKFNNRDILHKCIQSGTATVLWLVETVSNCLLIGQNFLQESSGPVLFGSPESLSVVVDRIHWKLCQKASLHHILPQHRPLQQDSNWHFNLILSTVFFCNYPLCWIWHHLYPSFPKDGDYRLWWLWYW